VTEPFQKWCLDIIWEIFSHSSKQHHYILIETDYFTWWTEEILLKQVNDQGVINFLQQNIISCFNVLVSLVSDNETYFLPLKLYEFALQNGIVLKHSSNYYPKGNSLAESTNNNLIRIIKKAIFFEYHNWHTALTNSLWADHVTPKPSMNTPPYFLVYSKEAILPPNIYLPALQLSQEYQGKPCQLVRHRMDALHKLQAERMKEKEKIILH